MAYQANKQRPYNSEIAYVLICMKFLTNVSCSDFDRYRIDIAHIETILHVAGASLQF
jgi:hypothetical protein